MSAGFMGCQNTPTRTATRPAPKPSVVKVETDDLSDSHSPLLNMGAPRKSKPSTDVIDVPMLDH
jgi:hypothetical protein